MRTRGILLAVGVALSLPAHAQERAKPRVDPRADTLLREMSRDLAAAKTFQVDTQHATEVVTEDGQKLQILARSRVSVQRPNKLRSDRLGERTDVTFYYDGSKMTLHGKRKNMYATAPAPDNLDQAIDFARDTLELDAPAADLLYSNPYAILMEDAVEGTYVGIVPIGNRMCHHLAYRGNETDWQIWIEDGPRALPCRFVITSKKVKGQPEYMVELSNWRIDPELAPRTFVFTPPRGATRIEFLAVADKKRALQEQGRKP